MREDIGSEGTVGHPGASPLIPATLQTISDGIAQGDEQGATSQLADLFLHHCRTSNDWNLLLQFVLKNRLVALLSTALEALHGLESVESGFWEDCAKALSGLGDEWAVELAFRQTVFSYPEAAALLDAFGLFLLYQGKAGVAADLYAGFLDANGLGASLNSLEPIYIHFAQALLRTGKNESALEVLLQLSLIAPEHREIDVLMATAFKNLRDFEQAISFLRKALPHHASQVDVTLDIGDCYNQLNRPDLAIEQYEATLSHDLNQRERELMLISLAQMYFRVGEHNKSISLYREVLAIDPTHVLAYFFLMISLSVVGRPQVELMKATAMVMWSSYRAAQDSPITVPDVMSARVPLGTPDLERRRIRIGLLSSEIGEHVVGFFLAPFLENYDRSKFQVDILSLRTFDDQRSVYLKSLADSAIELAGLDQFGARDIVQAGNYDIVVDTSGYLHSASLFILATRCAPVQCHYIGFHATTGLDTIDFFIGDSETVPEEFSADFSEELWRLPRPWLARSYSDGVPIAKSMATDECPVFGCFSSLHKLNRQTLHYWGGALQAVPNSLLLIKDRLSGVPTIQNLIFDVFREYGVEPARVTFLGQTFGWQQHMNHFNLIDIAFDTTPWSGATTAFDTLSMGVPLIGIRGDCTSARMSSSVLKAVDAESWISETPEQFASIARQLASDFETLRAEKEQLQHRVLTSKLYDAAGLAISLGNAFEQMINIRS